MQVLDETEIIGPKRPLSFFVGTAAQLHRSGRSGPGAPSVAPSFEQ